MWYLMDQTGCFINPNEISVVAHPASDDGSRYYRMSLPIRTLAMTSVREAYETHYQLVMLDTIAGPTVFDVIDPPDEQVVVFQRVLRKTTFEMMRVFQERYGKTCVLEMDDSFHDLPLRHPARREVDPLRDPLKNKEWLMRAAELADWVTVSTPALAERYGSHGRVSIVPNYVPARYLETPILCNSRIRVGWTGSTHTHIGDLLVTKGAVARAIADSGAELYVVGTGEDVARQLGHEGSANMTGWLSIDAYRLATSAMDIMVCPLKNNAFNKFKSWLKPLEAAALGVVPVMSPSAEYRRLHELYGIGLLADTPDEWYEAVVGLVRDESRRNEMACYGRKQVEKHLLIERNAMQWVEAWNKAAETTSKKLSVV